MSKLFNQSRHWSELTLGYAYLWATVYGFDYLFYPFVIYKLGLVRGGFSMAFLSLVICLITLKLYDWSKRDWLGIEALKRLREYQGESRFKKWTATILRRGDWAALILLSLKFDPFIATAYLRQSSFDGMGKRDWRNFLLSWIIGNLYWALACFGGMSALAWLWRKLS
jgi:hypothetical protein